MVDVLNMGIMDMLEMLKEGEMDTMTLFLQNISALLKETNLIARGLANSESLDPVYNYIKKFKIFKDMTSERNDVKSNIESEHLRTQGNDYYKHYKSYNALVCYTKSIAFAESKSSSLALAYGNRSAILFEKKYFKECLEDIERALLLNCSENLKRKLLNRKVKAEKLKYEQNLEKYHDNPPIIESKHSVISCAADFIKINYNRKYGRHIVATKDIQIGEVISVEDSFCHGVDPKSKYIHCHRCLELCYNMIPCENCIDALYCSKECRNKYYEEYHKYECRFPKMLFSTGLFFIKLALIGMRESKEFEGDGIHRSDSFKEILKLDMNESKLNGTTRGLTSIAASIAYHVLKKNQEFTKKFNSKEDNDNLKNFLYKAFLVNSFNLFSIKKKSYALLEKKTKNVGKALYAFSSLYNHSCVPNSDYSHYGSVLVVRANGHIKKGEQVTVCYEKHYTSARKLIRQAILQTKYVFDCDCKACTCNWPTIHELPHGKELPPDFQMKILANASTDTDSNIKLMEELLSEGKMLYYVFEKEQPCQNLILIQGIISQIYNKGCRYVKF